MSLIVDASVAVRWYITEEGSDRADAILAGGDLLIAPDLIFFEVGNALSKHVRRGSLTPAFVERAVDNLARAISNVVPLGTLRQSAIALALQHNHSIYDCAYVALTLATPGGVLATADKELAATARRAGAAVLDC